MDRDVFQDGAELEGCFKAKESQSLVFRKREPRQACLAFVP